MTIETVILKSINKQIKVNLNFVKHGKIILFLLNNNIKVTFSPIYKQVQIAQMYHIKMVNTVPFCTKIHLPKAIKKKVSAKDSKIK